MESGAHVHLNDIKTTLKIHTLKGMVKTKFALYKCVEIDDVTRFKKLPLILLLWKIP